MTSGFPDLLDVNVRRTPLASDHELMSEGIPMTHMTADTAQILELIGVAGFMSYVATYFALTLRWLDGNGTAYFACNMASASMVLIGLMASFNLASALIQVFWIGISIVAIALRILGRGPSEDTEPKAAA